MPKSTQPPSAADLIADCERTAQAVQKRLGADSPTQFHIGTLQAVVRTLCADIAELTRANEPPAAKAERLIAEALEVIASWSGHPVAGDDADSVHNDLSDVLGALRAIQFEALTEEEESR